MKRIAYASVVTSTLAILSQSVHAAPVDLNPFQHVKGDGVSYSPFILNLEAGNYLVTPVEGQYTAFSPWASNIDCDPSCVGEGGVHQGFGHYYGVTINGIEIIGRNETSNGLFYNSPIDALSAGTQTSFSLTESTNVEFYIPTGNPLSDNRGGISLSVTAVPLPASALLFASGFLGLFGVSRNSRNQKA